MEMQKKGAEMKDFRNKLQKVHDFVNGHEDSIPEKVIDPNYRLEEALAVKASHHFMNNTKTYTSTY